MMALLYIIKRVDFNINFYFKVHSSYVPVTVTLVLQSTALAGKIYGNVLLCLFVRDSSKSNNNHYHTNKV